MYAYTNSSRDIGNVKSISELIEHFRFIMGEMLRITKPGRQCCIHLTQEPVFKGKDGYVGLRDFRGKIISEMQDSGWIYYGEVTIDKNPQLKASRTKESTLLFKTLSQDSSNVRPALADYILIFKKQGTNDTPIRSGSHERWNSGAGWVTPEEWCEWAAPVWYRALPDDGRFPNYPSRGMATDGIRETDVLQVRHARDQEDEKHLCPLQLGVIERVIKLWSAPGDVVFSPFAGIGSEGYQALRFFRKFVGVELKESYWKVACDNMKRGLDAREEKQISLFADVDKQGRDGQ
jgi:DNA modification methylase